MSVVITKEPDFKARSVTERFADLADSLNEYLRKFREFGIRSNRAVAQYLCVDSAELSRLKNARVGDINLQRGYEILRKCEELASRLATFGGPMKCKDVYSVGFNITALPVVNSRERTHAVALQRQTDSVLLTIDHDTQRGELDMLLGDVIRSVVHPKRNPYGAMSIMYVLKSAYAAPCATPAQLRGAIRAVNLGRRACAVKSFNPEFGEEFRRRTLAVILNNGGGIALRLAKAEATSRARMLRLARFLHQQSLETFYFAGTIRGALTCANDLEDEQWGKELLRMFIERDGKNSSNWPRGINADLADPAEWQFLKSNGFWNFLDEQSGQVNSQPESAALRTM